MTPERVSPTLARKPLVEALVEIRWPLLTEAQGILRDPAYPIIVGQLYERIKTDYPFQERLPAADVPDEITPYAVKYRFRSSKDGWPVVQIGPGIATLNFTDGYSWNEFRPHAETLFDHLSQALSELQGEGLRPQSVLLRYINGVETGEGENLTRFLREKFHVSIEVPGVISSLDDDPGPSELVLRLSTPLGALGSGSLRIASGAKNGKPAIIWELLVQSLNDSPPQDMNAFSTWLNQSHDAAEKWFFALIEGELHDRFA